MRLLSKLVFPQGQRGNALFLILIAVALFAAVSYAVTRSGGGGGSIEKEKAEIVAARIIQNAGAMEQAINRLMLINKCTETQLNFLTPTNAYGNGTAPAGGICNIFDVRGGGVSWGKVGNDGNPHFTGSVQVTGIGTTAVDLVYFEYMDATLGPAVCKIVNQKMWGAQPPAYDGVSAASPFGGTYAGAPTGVIGEEAGGFYAGKQAGCFGSNLVAQQHFYYVLLAR